MSTIEMNGPPTIDEEEYYMSEIDIESPRVQPPTALQPSLPTGLPTLGDQSTLCKKPAHLEEEQEGTDHALDEDLPGEAVTTLKAHPRGSGG